MAILLAAALLLLVGCETSTYRAEDTETFFPTLRLSAEISPGRARGGEGDPGLGPEVHSGFLQTLEAETSYVTGSEEKTFTGTIEVDDTVFPPGTPLEGDFDLATFSLFSGSGYRTETGLEFAFLYGLEYTAFDLHVRGPVQSERLDENELGVMLGGRLRWLVTEWLRVYASTRISALRYSLEQSEAGVEVRVVPRLSLFAGYRRSEYEFDDDEFDSEVDVRWKGIVAGLQLEF